MLLLCAVCGVLFVVCCVLYVVKYLLRIGLMSAVRCLVFVGVCSLCCCCLLFVGCFCCLVFGAWCSLVDVSCFLFLVSCCLFLVSNCDDCCLPFVVCGMLVVGR